jgi:calcium permeable stress-gated cation channel
MAVQTLLDPEPHHYTAHLAPAPKDIVWKNTYMSKRERMFRAWTISICISLLTIIWLFPVSILAAFLNLKSIAKFFPGFAKYLENSQLIGSLVQNFAPTLILTLLNVAIPYLYDCKMNSV